MLLLLLAAARAAAGAGLLGQLLLRQALLGMRGGRLLLLLMGAAAAAGLLAAKWLLRGGCQASFPLADTLLDRGLVGKGILFRWGVGRGWVRTEVREVLIRPLGLAGVEPGGWARLTSFADAGGLAPPTGSRAIEDGGGGEGSCEDAEGEDFRQPGRPSPPVGLRLQLPW